MIKYSVLQFIEKVDGKRIVSKDKLKKCCLELEKTASFNETHTCSCGNTFYVIEDYDDGGESISDSSPSRAA